MMNYQQAEEEAIKAAKQAIIDNYDAARAELSARGLFGKELDRKARKAALAMAGFKLPEGWTIARVTPDGWGSGAIAFRGRSAQDMLKNK